jgi:hypothetical protein
MSGIGSLNGARGSLRAKLLRGLFNPVSGFLTVNCSCSPHALKSFQVALSKTNIWPLHDQHKKSVRAVLDSPGFKKWEPKIPDNACSGCISRLSSRVIMDVHNTISVDFHGLCLDCMKMTKTGNEDDDYFEHDLKKKWDSGCRIKHGQPTWYFSYMGRKSELKKHQERKKRLQALHRQQWHYYSSDSD